MLVAVDTETHLITPQAPIPRLVCLSWATEFGESGLVTREDAEVQFLRLLRRPDPRIGGANFSFDLLVLIEAFPTLRPLIIKGLEDGIFYDTHVLEQLHGIGKGKLDKKISLAMLEWRYFRRDRSASKGPDAWRLRYGELDGVPFDQWPEEARQYPIDDAKGTLDVLKHQLGPGRLNVHCMPGEMCAAFALARTSANGLQVDPVEVTKVQGVLEQECQARRAAALQNGLMRVVTKKGIDLYQGNLAAVRERVFLAYGSDTPRTPKGNVSYSKDVLQESGDPVLEEYAALGTYSKLLTSFVPLLLRGVESGVHCRYNVLVSSGRTSASKPNVQQLPREGTVRNCFVPPSGCIYVDADYSTLELCTLAFICRSLGLQSALGDALERGDDLHIRVAAQALHRPYSEVLAAYKGGDEAISKLRQVIKIVVYGFAGLMGPAKLVKQARKDGIKFCELAGTAQNCASQPRVAYYNDRVIAPTCVACLRAAKTLKKVVLATYPEVKGYHAWVKKLVNAGEPLVSFGNGMIRKEGKVTAACNHFFQNLAAQGAKDALWRLVAYQEQAMRPVVFMHDEIIAIAPSATADQAKALLQSSMLSAMSSVIPGIKVKAEPKTMTRWVKK